VVEFTEAETGTKVDRPQLEKALKMCKKTRATLVIAKLDRLARIVHFISGLMEQGVKFCAVEFPGLTARKQLRETWCPGAERSREGRFAQAGLLTRRPSAIKRARL
jgi:hypothetical protein